MSNRPAGDQALARMIGVPQLAAATVNCTIGAGIFVLPAVAAQGLGPAAPIAFLACAGLMLLVVLSVAMAGSRVSTTGGMYAYAETAFGAYVGFITGIIQWLSSLLAVAAVASAFLDQFGTVVPALATWTWRMVTLVLMVGGLALANIRGVRTGSRVIEGVTAAKLLPLLLLVVAGAWYVHPATLAWRTIPSAHAIGDAVLLVVFAFFGVEVAVMPGGEMRDPARTIPLATLLALAFTATLYMAIQVVAAGVLGTALAGAAAPLAQAANEIFGPAGSTLMLAGGAISSFGYLSGDMLSTPRNLFALGRDGFLPRACALVHTRYRTPAVAIAAHATMVVVLAATSGFKALLLLTNVGTLALYLICCLSAIELMRRDVRMNGAPFVVRGGRVIAALGALAIVWVLSHAAAREWGALGATLAAATLLYGIRDIARARSQRGSAVPV